MTKEYDFAGEDQLAVRDSEGRIVVQVGLFATLYFENAHLPRTREAVAKSVERLQSICDPHLRWVAHPKSGKMYPRSSRRVPSFGVWMDQQGRDQTWEYHIHGGAHPDAASHFQIEAFGPADWKQALGYLKFALPITWFADHPGSFPDLVLELCNNLRPIHGYGGLGLLESYDMGVENASQPAIYAMARRFPGLEVDTPLSHARYLKDGLKGVNWITIVDERWLPVVGGATALKKLLGESVLVYEYPGGLLVQAGPRPQMGDANDGRTPELYRRVAQALRPIRVRTVGSLHYSGENRFTPRTSDEWLHRFDTES